MTQYTQAGRLLELETPLGKDVLLLQELRGTEGLSRLFHFRLKLLSTNSAIQYDKIIGKNVTIKLLLPESKERFINGYVSRFVQGHSDFRFTEYEMEVVPWLWFLTRTADCRIFQNKTIPDVITQIFSDLGFHDFSNKLQGSFETREFCVQYRETDFNFVSRLMEQEGIYYFFEHERNKHTLVLANSPTMHKPCPIQSKVRYASLETQWSREDLITGLSVTQELRPGKYALMDYDFTKPSTNLGVSVPSAIKVGDNQKYEVYDYPGEYQTKAAGEEYAKVRMEEEEAVHYVLRGESSCRTFTSGYSFDMQDHYRRDLNKTYVLTEVNHYASVGHTYVSDSTDEGAETYSNTFECIPKSVPFRPPRVTPKPLIQGPQTAVVTGPAGEEIYVDKYGRVKVQFHWDREGKKDEKSSCWIRVSQPWAGKAWGGMWIPRIGQEVIVEFLEGDPDQPIITGRVYNAEQMPPYELPTHMTRSTMLSRSTKGGTKQNFNELRFEDKKGAEQVFLHAEKDLDLRVKNDAREIVLHDRHLIVENNQIEKVQKDKHLQVGGNQYEKIGKDYSREIAGSAMEKVTGDSSLEVIGNQNTKVTGDISRQSVMNIHEKSGMNWAHEAGMQIHLKGGLNVVIESGLQITLKGAGGFININPVGVFIQGNMVFINSGGAAGAGSGTSPKDPKPTKSPLDPDKADDGSKGTKL
jgi:type VI secretion system secreted protein VgrG